MFADVRLTSPVDGARFSIKPVLKSNKNFRYEIGLDLHEIETLINQMALQK